MTGPISIGQAGLNGRPHALYRFYDRSDVLLYVGITMDLPKRLKAHRKEKPWWLEISSITVEPHESRAAALDAEAEAIRSEKPLYNTTHNTFVAQGPITPEQAVADFAEVVLSRLNIFDDEIAEYLSEVDEDEHHDSPYPMPKIAAAALIASEVEAGGRITLALGARHVLDQIDPDLRAEFERRAIAEAKRWDFDTSGGLDAPEVMENVLNLVAAMMAQQYLDSLAPAESAEWIECAKAVYEKSGEDTIARMAASYARQRKHNGAVPPQMCLGEGKHGAGCPSKAELDIQFTCEEGHVSEWFRFCSTHAKDKEEGVTHQGCGAAAKVTSCEPTQALDWGWV